MKAIQAPYFAAVEAVEGLKRTRTVPEGYERNYRKGSLFVCVCPWHWRAYSHYQFWEVLAAAHLAKLGRARHAILATNGEWTDWCWNGFEAVFDRVLIGEPREVAAEIERAIDEKPKTGIGVPRPDPGEIFFGAVRKTATTMTLKASLDAGLTASGERIDKRSSAPVYYGGPRPATFHHALANGLIVDPKGFRNPDPMHEIKILAGKAFAVGPERARRILYVVDGRVSREELAPITAAGANVTTPDKFRDAARTIVARIRAAEEAA